MAISFHFWLYFIIFFSSTSPTSSVLFHRGFPGVENTLPSASQDTGDENSRKHAPLPATPLPPLRECKHWPTHRGREKVRVRESVRVWKRLRNLEGGLLVENPKSCQLTLVHPTLRQHTPSPVVTFSVSLSLFAERQLPSSAIFFTASQADWGNVKAEAWLKPRNSLLSQRGKLCKTLFECLIHYREKVAVNLFVMCKVVICTCESEKGRDY